MNSCYCGNTTSYANCCGRIHQDINLAKTAEALMRSRYSAFAMADGDYLMESHHFSTRPLKEKKEIIKWAKSVEWIKLEVLNTSKGLENDTKGTVAFKAFFYENNSVQILHENSSFIRENGHWVYLGEK